MGNDVTKLPPIKEGPPTDPPPQQLRRVKTMTSIRLDDDMTPHQRTSLEEKRLIQPPPDEHDKTKAERVRIEPRLPNDSAVLEVPPRPPP